MFGRVMALIVVFPVLYVHVGSSRTVFYGPGGNYFDFLSAELALKRSEYCSAIWRVGVNRRMFLPPLSTALVTAEPLPALFWFVSPSTVIAKLHTFLSTVI